MEKKVLQQDLSNKNNNLGTVFIIHLLMEEKCEMPSIENFENIFRKHLNNVDNFSYSNDAAFFNAKDYNVHFEKDNVTANPQLMITACREINDSIMDDLAITQLWNCPDGVEILEQCKYQVIATDFLAAGLDYKDRAKMLVSYIEALMDLYPSSKAVVFDNSKKMLTREYILHCDIPKELRFIDYAVNVRFFNIENTKDMIVDSLGMSTLFLPDLQYHFHSLDPNEIVRHAYDVLYYIFEYNNPIEDGNTIAGVTNGEMNENIKWKLQYEQSLIQPLRDVIDVNMLEFAAGDRD